MCARVSVISLFWETIEANSSSQRTNLHTHTHTHTLRHVSQHIDTMKITTKNLHIYEFWLRTAWLSLRLYLCLTGWQVHGFVCDMKALAKNKAQTYFLSKESTCGQYFHFREIAYP